MPVPLLVRKMRAYSILSSSLFPGAIAPFLEWDSCMVEVNMCVSLKALVRTG